MGHRRTTSKHSHGSKRAPGTVTWGASNNLSVMYRLGQGTPVDLQKANYLADSTELAKRRKALVASSAGGQGSTGALNALGNLLGYVVLGQLNREAGIDAKVAHEAAVIEDMNGGMSRVKAEEVV